jgi:hypothetical protein
MYLEVVGCLAMNADKCSGREWATGKATRETWYDTAAQAVVEAASGEG